MPETKRYDIKGKQILFHEMKHCIHSNTVKKKQRVHEVKWPRSSQLRNTNCAATIHIHLENWCIELSHPLEVNLKFMHNHVIISAKTLSFHCVNEEVRERFLKLFKDRHFSTSLKYIY